MGGSRVSRVSQPDGPINEKLAQWATPGDVFFFLTIVLIACLKHPPNSNLPDRVGSISIFLRTSPFNSL